MILLVNRERVIYELVELSRLKIARELYLDNPEVVHAEVSLGDDGKMRARFGVDKDALVGFRPERVRDIIGTEYKETRAKMEARFSRLGERWQHGGEEDTSEEEGPREEDSEAGEEG